MINMAYGSLNEFFSSKKKATTAYQKPVVKPLTPEQLDEVKELKDKIKKLAPKSVADENKDPKSKKYLDIALESLFIKGSSNMNRNVTRKFVYRLIEDDKDKIIIGTLDKSVETAVDNTFDEYDQLEASFYTNLEDPLYNIGERIYKQLDPETVKINMNAALTEGYEYCGGIIFQFLSK